jgi:C4-dicarboxylate-specific signal transduction histidine kinase
VGSLDAGESDGVFLVDEDGIVIAHHDPSLLFHSVSPVTEDSRQRISPRERFQTDDIPCLNVPELESIRRATAAGQLDYVRPGDGSRRAVAYAPLRERPWVLAVDMDQRQFAGPVALRVWRDALGLALAGLLVAALAVPVIRRFRSWWVTSKGVVGVLGVFRW